VSSLWTPYGEHEPGAPSVPAEEASGPTGRPPDTPAGEASRPVEEVGPDPELAEELQRMRAQLLEAPVADIVANHAVGLWQLAIVHLAPDADEAPKLAEAGLAIDALAALVDGLGDRLGEHAAPLREALAQLRLVFVQASRDGAEGAGGDGHDAGESA
jgi:hypothetical protein